MHLPPTVVTAFWPVQVGVSVPSIAFAWFCLLVAVCSWSACTIWSFLGFSIFSSHSNLTPKTSPESSNNLSYHSFVCYCCLLYMVMLLTIYSNCLCSIFQVLITVVMSYFVTGEKLLPWVRDLMAYVRCLKWNYTTSSFRKGSRSVCYGAEMVSLPTVYFPGCFVPHPLTGVSSGSTIL